MQVTDKLNGLTKNSKLSAISINLVTNSIIQLIYDIYNNLLKHSCAAQEQLKFFIVDFIEMLFVEALNMILLTYLYTDREYMVVLHLMEI